MKITGGTKKGRQLDYPRGIRPTSDKVREAIFATLTQRVTGARVLDLYAGSGALGFEALSRGAQSLVSVDRSSASIKAIKRNAIALKASSEAIQSDARLYIRKASERFDLIFADPPYEETDWQIIDESTKLLNFDGIIVVEYASRTELPGLEHLYERETKRYGDTTISYLSPHI